MNAQDAQTTQIDLIRHGEPVGGRRYRGQRDDPLSETGWAQMWCAVGDNAPWDLIVSSPLARCRDFAQALAEKTGIPLSLDSRLKEVGFGSWEGRTADELRASDPELMRNFYHDPLRYRPSDAEPLETFHGRVSEALQDALERYRGSHLLLVVHAGVIRAALTHVLQAPLRSMYLIHVDNAAVTRIRADGERPPTVVFHGRSSF